MSRQVGLIFEKADAKGAEIVPESKEKNKTAKTESKGIGKVSDGEKITEKGRK